jgi:hypothetical protein
MEDGCDRLGAGVLDRNLMVCAGDSGEGGSRDTQNFDTLALKTANIALFCAFWTHFNMTNRWVNSTTPSVTSDTEPISTPTTPSVTRDCRIDFKITVYIVFAWRELARDTRSEVRDAGPQRNGA